MKLFKLKSAPVSAANNQSAMAEMALKFIHDGVVITDKAGVIQFANPAGATMAGYATPDKVVGLDYGLVLKLESKEGRELSEAENPLIQAMRTNQALDGFQGSLIVGQSDKRIPVSVSVLPPDGLGGNRIITFRNIAKELEEEGEQTEFISTASHEMRTPVATIDGYLSLALNPQTASVDERARGYLTAAQAASKHLGKLFQDLLDVTKLDDGRVRPHFQPVEMSALIRDLANDHAQRAAKAKINFSFGSDQDISFGENRRLDQVVYSYVDPDFMREIMDNLIDNAIKYTPDGGSVYVNVRGDGDRVLINVTDTGMGISAEDIGHIFQKFYRADNSDTRTIGGTGLGLYLVKQRVEAMGGRVWAESAFGEGSTFFVSLPRLTQEEYDKRMIAVQNQALAQSQASAPAPTPTSTPTTVPTSVSTPTVAPLAPAAPTPSTPASMPVPTPVAPVVQPTAPTPAQPVAPKLVQPMAPTPVQQPPTTPNVTAKPNQIDININGGTK